MHSFFRFIFIRLNNRLGRIVGTWIITEVEVIPGVGSIANATNDITDGFIGVTFPEALSLQEFAAKYGDNVVLSNEGLRCRFRMT